MENEDLLATAIDCVNNCLYLRRQETVLIVTDEDKIELANILRIAIEKGGGRPSIILLPSSRERKDDPISYLNPTIKNAIKAASLILTPFTGVEGELRPFRYELYQTALDQNARLVIMKDLEKQTFRSGGLTANYLDVKERSDLLAEILSKANHIKIVSGTFSDGTEIILNIGHLEGWKQLGFSDSGHFMNDRCFGNLPAGEAYIALKNLFAINGSLKVDLFINDIGSLMEPIYLDITQGVITNISGGRQAEKLEDRLSRAELDAEEHNLRISHCKTLSEFGIGTNDKAEITGSAIEIEKILKTIHLAIGDNIIFGGSIKAPLHLDCVVGSPTVYIDDRLIMNNGILEPLNTLNIMFQEDYRQETFAPQNISPDFLVHRISTDIHLETSNGKSLLYRRWEDNAKHDQLTQVGNEETSELARKVFSEIGIGTKISELVEKCGEELETIQRVLNVLKYYRLVDIGQRDLFVELAKLADQVKDGFSRVGNDLSQYQADNDQDGLLLKSISTEFRNLNEKINEKNISQTLEIIEEIAKVSDQIRPEAIGGRFKIASVPPFFLFEGELDFKKALRILKSGSEKLAKAIESGVILGA